MKGASHGETTQNVPTNLLTEYTFAVRSLEFNSLDQFDLSMNILLGDHE